MLLIAAATDASEFGEPIVLGALDPNVDRSFGSALAIDGDTLAVGAPSTPEGGAVYVYERTREPDRPWRLLTILAARTPKPRERFGSALALQGDTLAVGAPHEASRGELAGAVHIFRRVSSNPGRWRHLRTLAPRSVREYSYYGHSVALSGDLLAVGAPEVHKVYVHERHRTGRDRWGVQAELEAEIASSVVQRVLGVRGRAAGFGARVALSGRVLVATAINHDIKYGSALVPQWSYGTFLYEFEDGHWRQRRHLISPALSRDGDRDYFGSGLGLDGSVLLIGHSSTDASGCHLYERHYSGRERWGRRMELRDSKGLFRNGQPVAVRGNTAVMAGRFEFGRSKPDPKGALVYRRHAPVRNQWGAVARLLDTEVTDWPDQVAIGPREVALGYGYPGIVQVFPRRPLVAADFEGGEIAGVSRFAGNVRVLSPGLGGTDHALAVAADGTATRSLVRARQPVREPIVDLGFTLAANRVGLADRRVEVMSLYGPTRDLLRMSLEEDPVRDQYWATLEAWEQGHRWRRVGRVRMPPLRGVRMEVQWRAANGPGSGDGRVVWLVDGRLRAELGGLDTDLQVVNGLLLGLPKGSEGTAGGELLLDEIELHR